MTSGPIPAEVVVIGGGPAGATAAALLAGWGHAVVLLTREAPPQAELGESIPPSAGKLLAEVGALEALAAAGLHPNGGNTVRWAGGPDRTETFAEGAAGWHADRAALERVLLERAARRGARVRRVRVHKVERADEDWRVVLAPGNAARGSGGELRASWLLDATGRAGVVARLGHRVADPDTRTVALVGRWRRAEGWAHVPPTHTLVESGESGWAWSVPLSSTERCVTAMVDPDVTDLGAGGDLTEPYRAQLEGCEQVARLLRDATPVGPAWACPAGLYTATSFVGPGLLLVGDAGSFIDPLSSYGVKKALASAWLAAVATHTALADPSMTRAALALYDANEAEVYRSYRRLSAPFFEQAAGAYGHPFWERRARSAAAAGAGADVHGDPADRPPGAGRPSELPSEGSVRAAYEAVRAAETLSVGPAPTLRRVDRPAIRGNRIGAVPHLQSDGSPAGLRWVRGVDLETLVEEAPRHRQVPDVYEAYCRRSGQVPLPDFLAALATALAAGFLEQRTGV